MKSIISVVLAVLFTPIAWGAAAPKSAGLVCDKHFVCGTYVGEGQDTDGKRKTVKVVIAETSPGVASFAYTEDQQTWDLEARFEADGSFKMFRKRNNTLYATGVCLDQFCDFALMPFEDQGKVYGNSGYMRFQGNTLEMRFNYGTPLDTGAFTVTVRWQP